VLIGLFSLAVTAEALQAKRDWKSALCNGVGQSIFAKFSCGVPHQSFSHG